MTAPDAASSSDISPFKWPDQPGHAVRLHRRQEGIELAHAQRPHLVECAGGKHVGKALLDAREKFLALAG